MEIAIKIADVLARGSSIYILKDEQIVMFMVEKLLSKIIII